MQPKQPAELEVKPVVTVDELRQLLISMLEYSLPVRFRYRLAGNIWEVSFTKVIQITENGVLLECIEESRTFFIPNLSAIKQFQLDCGWRKFGARCHFHVRDTYLNLSDKV